MKPAVLSGSYQHFTSSLRIRCNNSALRSSRKSRNSRSFASFLPLRTGTKDPSANDSNIRNIGIIAHIDAGKTTTTERMLFYSGYTRRIGNVDEGSTVTDFLPAERARGITIQSAAITFHWPPNLNPTPGGLERGKQLAWRSQLTSGTPCQINLIDTPGHADFTFEVRRSLRVLDGAVCILDGVAGVEAQTEEVWKQAGLWHIPRIVYVNKLDRDGAAFGRAVREVGVRLRGWPAVCQIPWWEGGKGKLIGVADVIGLQGLLYDSGSDGRHVTRFNLAQLDEDFPRLATELRRARTALIELLSEHDDGMVEAFFEADEDHLAIRPSKIAQSIRTLLADGKNVIIPIFAGSSFRNIGVQPLLDAVVALLPSPSERPDAEVNIGQQTGTLQQALTGAMNPTAQQQGHRKLAAHTNRNFPQSENGCALAFKVVTDPRRGVLVYFRVYSGSIKRGDTLYNTNLKISEKAGTILQMFANDSMTVNEIKAGNIGVVAGSKYARTGDTFLAYQSGKSTPPEPLAHLQLRPIEVPPPVFFASVEPRSFREERDVQEKLALLLREDPSLHVHQDADTGQTLLSGMGELHLEIAADRLVSHLKAHATIGAITIGYRETPNGGSEEVEFFFEKDKTDAKGKAGCRASISTWHETALDHDDVNQRAIFSQSQDGNLVTIQAPMLDIDGKAIIDEGQGWPPTLTWETLCSAYFNGVVAALSRGPKRSYPVRGAEVNISFDPSAHLFGNETTPSALSSSARLATIAALKDANSRTGMTLMEPIMSVDIIVDDAHLGNVSQDISSSRGGQIITLGEEEAVSNNAAEPTPIDLQRIYAPKDPYETDPSLRSLDPGASSDKSRTIKAKVPLKEMVGYLKHLRSLTGGRGTFVMAVDRFVKMPALREKMLLAALDGTSNS